MQSKNRFFFQFFFSTFITVTFLLFFYTNQSIFRLVGVLIPGALSFSTFGLIGRFRPRFFHDFQIHHIRGEMKFVHLLVTFFLLTTFIFVSILLKEIITMNFFQSLILIGTGVARIALIIVFFSTFSVIIVAFGQKLLRERYVLFLSGSIIAFGFGLGSLSIIVFLLGITKLFYPSMFLAVLIFIAVLCFRNIQRIILSLLQWKMTLDARLTEIQFIVPALILILLSFLTITLAHPQPIDYDGLHIYFNVSQLWLENHQYMPIYNFATANASQVGEMIFVFILGLTNSFAVSYTPFLIFILCIVLVYFMGKEMLGKNAGYFGALVFAFIPMFGSLAVQFKVDIFAVFFFLLFVHCLYRALSSGMSRKWIFLAGFMAGSAIGAKYTNLIFIGLALAVVSIFSVVKYRPLPWKKIGFHALIFGLTTAVIFSPWLIKNLYYFQKPFFPFSFGQKVIHDQQLLLPDNELVRSVTKNRYYEFSTAVHDYEYSSRPILNFFMKMWQISSFDKRGYLIPHAVIGPLFLLALLFLFFHWKRSPLIFIGCLLLTFGAVVWYVKLRPELWYFSPVLALSTLIVGAMIDETKSFPVIRKTLSFFLIVFVINAFPFFSTHFNTEQAVLYLSAKKNTKETFEASSLYRVSQYINTSIINTGAPVRILSYPDSRVNHIQNNNLTTIPDLYGLYFAVIVQQEGDVDHIYKRLKKENFTHLLLSRELIENFESAFRGMNNVYYQKLDPSLNTFIEDYRMFAKLANKYGRELYCTQNIDTGKCDPGYVLYELL